MGSASASYRRTLGRRLAFLAASAFGCVVPISVAILEGRHSSEMECATKLHKNQPSKSEVTLGSI